MEGSDELRELRWTGWKSVGGSDGEMVVFNDKERPTYTPLEIFKLETCLEFGLSLSQLSRDVLNKDGRGKPENPTQRTDPNISDHDFPSSPLSSASSETWGTRSNSRRINLSIP